MRRFTEHGANNGGEMVLATWSGSTNRSEPNAAEASLFGYYLATLSANLRVKLESNQEVDPNEAVCFYTRWILCFFFGRGGFFLEMPRVQVFVNRIMPSHDTHAHTRARAHTHPTSTQRAQGNGGGRGGRRTCLKEMCWLKSIEVEDKKNIRRKVPRYFWIYKSTHIYFKLKVFFFNIIVFMSHFKSISFVLDHLTFNFETQITLFFPFFKCKVVEL